jgi:hypothetical protein
MSMRFAIVFSPTSTWSESDPTFPCRDPVKVLGVSISSKFLSTLACNMGRHGIFLVPSAILYSSHHSTSILSGARWRGHPSMHDRPAKLRWFHALSSLHIDTVGIEQFDLAILTFISFQDCLNVQEYGVAGTFVFFICVKMPGMCVFPISIPFAHPFTCSNMRKHHSFSLILSLNVFLYQDASMVSGGCWREHCLLRIWHGLVGSNFGCFLRFSSSFFFISFSCWHDPYLSFHEGTVIAIVCMMIESV